MWLGTDSFLVTTCIQMFYYRSSSSVSAVCHTNAMSGLRSQSNSQSLLYSIRIVALPVTKVVVVSAIPRHVSGVNPERGHASVVAQYAVSFLHGQIHHRPLTH